MAPTIASTVVDRPAAQVFAYATDPARFNEWQQGVIDGHLDQPGPPQVGTKSLTTAVDFDGHGIGRLLVPLIVRRQAQKEMPANVEALKRRVEAQQPQHPA